MLERHAETRAGFHAKVSVIAGSLESNLDILINFSTIHQYKYKKHSFSGSQVVMLFSSWYFRKLSLTDMLIHRSFRDIMWNGFSANLFSNNISENWILLIPFTVTVITHINIQMYTTYTKS